MTDSPDQPDTTRRDALFAMVTKYEILRELQDRVDEAKDARNGAKEDYEEATARAEEICQQQKYTGTMVRGTMVIRVYASGVTIYDGEILE